MNFESLFFSYAKEPILHIEPLPASGSYRKYYRISGTTKHCLGVENTDQKENIAFLDFTHQFENLGLNVPQILAENLNENQYLIQDLGDETLFSYLTKHRETKGFDHHLIEIYKKVIDLLLEFQIRGGESFDYSNVYSRAAFDKQSMLWDLHYFKYYFLKLIRISFDEQALETDFNEFANFLLRAPADHFMFRDFQSRNIMLHEGEIFFIDYQGGRKGALQYDLASLLNQAKANLPYEVRDELLDYYIEKLRGYTSVDEPLFRKQYDGFVFIRILQTLGAYGFRGFFERKDYFLKSIPFAIDNLEYFLKNTPFPTGTIVLEDLLTQLVRHPKLRQPAFDRQSSNLQICIHSFSFKKGYPDDLSGNGGGFVFDCRGLPNPGRCKEYQTLTGKDAAVKKYLEQYSEVDEFIANAFHLTESTIRNYMLRNFEHLQINFGCTGGQHRSVYCAEKMAEKISQTFNIKIIINHREQN